MVAICWLENLLFNLDKIIMRKFYLLFVVALIAASSASAQIPIRYHGEVDLGYSLGIGTFASDRVNLHTIQGLKIGQYFSTGVGLGLDYHHQLYEKGELVVPVYLNLKGYLPVNNIVSPYISMDLGVGIGATEGVSGLSGLYFTPAVGVAINKFKVQLGYNLQRVSEMGIGINVNAMQLKLGFVF